MKLMYGLFVILSCVLLLSSHSERIEETQTITASVDSVQDIPTETIAAADSAAIQEATSSDLKSEEYGYVYCNGYYCGYNYNYYGYPDYECCGSNCCSYPYSCCNNGQCSYCGNYYNDDFEVIDDNYWYNWECNSYSCYGYNGHYEKPNGCCGSQCCFGSDKCCSDTGYCTSCSGSADDFNNPFDDNVNSWVCGSTNCYYSHSYYGYYEPNGCCGNNCCYGNDYCCDDYGYCIPCPNNSAVAVAVGAIIGISCGGFWCIGIVIIVMVYMIRRSRVQVVSPTSSVVAAHAGIQLAAVATANQANQQAGGYATVQSSATPGAVGYSPQVVVGQVIYPNQMGQVGGVMYPNGGQMVYPTQVGGQVVYSNQMPIGQMQQPYATATQTPVNYAAVGQQPK